PFIVPFIRLMTELTKGDISLPYYHEHDPDEVKPVYESAKSATAAGTTGRQILIDMIDGIRARDPLFLTRIMVSRVEASSADVVIVDNVGFEHEWQQLYPV